MRVGTIYGHMTIRPECYATFDVGPPPTVADKIIDGIIIGVPVAAFGTLTVIAAISNPVLFGIIFASSFTFSFIAARGLGFR